MTLTTRRLVAVAVSRLVVPLHFWVRGRAFHQGLKYVRRSVRSSRPRMMWRESHHTAYVCGTKPCDPLSRTVMDVGLPKRLRNPRAPSQRNPQFSMQTLTEHPALSFWTVRKKSPPSEQSRHPVMVCPRSNSSVSSRLKTTHSPLTWHVPANTLRSFLAVRVILRNGVMVLKFLHNVKSAPTGAIEEMLKCN